MVMSEAFVKEGESSCSSILDQSVDGIAVPPSCTYCTKIQDFGSGYFERNLRILV